MTLIKIKGEGSNDSDARNQMHKTRRKVLDVMNGTDTKDTFGWTPTKKETDSKNEVIDLEREEKRKLFDSIRTPSFCPKCKKFMKGRMDVKFYNRTGACFTCQQDYEHRLRTNGLYELWERIKIFQNEVSIMLEHKEKLADAYNSLTPTSEFISSDGHITTFEFAGNWQEIKESIRTDLDWIEETLPAAQEKLEEMKSQLREKDIKNIVSTHET